MWALTHSIAYKKVVFFKGKSVLSWKALYWSSNNPETQEIYGSLFGAYPKALHVLLDKGLKKFSFDISPSLPSVSAEMTLVQSILRARESKTQKKKKSTVLPQKMNSLLNMKYSGYCHVFDKKERTKHIFEDQTQGASVPLSKISQIINRKPLPRADTNNLSILYTFWPI